MPENPLSLRVYRWLLKFYPAGFRDRYATPMEREFRDEWMEAHGWRPRASLWGRLLRDLAVSIPAQVAREAYQDSRHTLRLWARRPWHTAFAIAALAIGIGANTGVFSVVNGLLLHALPFHEPERLASMDPYEFIPPHDSAKAFHEWRGQSAYLANAALTEDGDVNLGAEDEARRAHVAVTSWNFFHTLGAGPVLGRGFMAGEDVEGRNGVAVIGHGLWQQLFAGERRALSSTIRVDGELYVIVGVAPPGFDYPGGSVVWRPAIFRPGNNGWATVARLREGITWQQAQAAFDADVRQVAPEHTGARPKLRPLRDALAGPAREGTLVLLAGVGLVLLIACTNVANLLMARTVERAGELSIRAALGASRGRLMQQLLAECLLLAAIATAAGLLVAYWTVSFATQVQPPPLAAQSYSVLDLRVLGFGVFNGACSALLFGVLPSLYAGRISAIGSRGSGGTRASRWVRDGLVAVQVMLTIVLLTASISVGRAFVRLMSNDRGYDVKGVVTVSVALDGTAHQERERRLPYFEAALARVRSLPGVRSASATEFLPLYANGFVGGPFGMDGRSLGRNSTMIPVLSGYFETMGGRILHGREFTDAEVRTGAKVAIVNERFALGFGDPAGAVGRQLTAGRSVARRIVGVVRGMNYETDPTLRDARQVFIPSEAPGGFFSTFVARVDGRAEEQLAVVRDAIRSVDPGVPVFGVKSMEQRLDELFARPKFYRTAVWLFAGFALLLAGIGVFGVVSCAVAQRTQEMGVRLALGTTPVRLRGALLRQGLTTVAAGAIPGVVLAVWAGWSLERLIEGAKGVEAAAVVAAVLFLGFVAASSIWAATRRIAGLDVMTILRAE